MGNTALIFKYHCFFLVPSRAPSYIRLSNLHLTDLKVHWNPLSEQYTNGRLLGYRVYYREYTPRYNDYYDPYLGKSVNTSSANVTVVILRDLRQLTAYRIAVAAFTSKGDGLLSSWHVITTGNAFFCSRYYLIQIISVSLKRTSICGHPLLSG